MRFHRRRQRGVGEYDPRLRERQKRRRDRPPVRNGLPGRTLQEGTGAGNSGSRPLFRGEQPRRHRRSGRRTLPRRTDRRTPPDHTAPLRLSQNIRGLQLGVRVLRDPADPGPTRLGADGTTRRRSGGIGPQRSKRADRHRTGHDLLRVGPLRRTQARRPAAQALPHRRNRMAQASLCLSGPIPR